MEITLFTASGWPSDWGWNAEDRWSLTSVIVNSSVQNLLVKMGSRSLTMELGIPCSRTMSLKKARVMDVAV
jgi:hypothetical protein